MNYDYLKKYIHKYKGQYIVAITFIILETLVDIINPTIMSQIVDIGVRNRDLDYILRLGGIMLLITAIGAVLQLLGILYLLVYPKALVLI